VAHTYIFGSVKRVRDKLGSGFCKQGAYRRKSCRETFFSGWEMLDVWRGEPFDYNLGFQFCQIREH
jgi:hypothetical protein